MSRIKRFKGFTPTSLSNDPQTHEEFPSSFLVGCVAAGQSAKSSHHAHTIGTFSELVSVQVPTAKFSQRGTFPLPLV